MVDRLCESYWIIGLTLETAFCEFQWLSLSTSDKIVCIVMVEKLKWIRRIHFVSVCYKTQDSLLKDLY